MKETLTLTGDEGRDIVWEENEDFQIIYDHLKGKSRWSDIHEIVVQRISDGKYFKSSFRRGATESQDERPYEYGDAVFNEVVPVEKTVIVYE
jgi:hypothetical protein